MRIDIKLMDYIITKNWNTQINASIGILHKKEELRSNISIIICAIDSNQPNVNVVCGSDA